MSKKKVHRPIDPKSDGDLSNRISIESVHDLMPLEVRKSLQRDLDEMARIRLQAEDEAAFNPLP